MSTWDTLPQEPGAVRIRDGAVYINVWTLRADVARFREMPDGSMTSEYAANSDDLNENAASAVYAQGGALNASGFYHCPPELAARAVWPDAQEEGPETEDISAWRGDPPPATEPDSDSDDITAAMLLALVRLLRTVTTRHEALLDAVRLLPSSTHKDAMLSLLGDVGAQLDTLIDQTDAAVSGGHGDGGQAERDGGSAGMEGANDAL